VAVVAGAAPPPNPDGRGAPGGSPQATFSFYKNGAALGPAWEAVPVSGPLFPAAHLKNAEVHLRFGPSPAGGDDPAHAPPPGFSWLDSLPAPAKAASAGRPLPPSATPSPNPPTALVLEPTRDLAEQAADAFVGLAARLPPPGVRVLCVTGGSPAGPQKAALAGGEADVVVGTLGRVTELVEAGDLQLHGVRVCVLDEADRLLESSGGGGGGSGREVASLVGRLPKGGAGAARLQVLMFSATLQSPAVEAAAAALCANPIHVDLKAGGQRAPGGGPAAGTALPEGVDHVLIRVDPRADRSWLQASPAVPTDGVHAPDAGRGGAPLLSPDADSPEAWSEAVKRLKPRLVARLADALKMEQAILFVRTNHDAACLQRFLDGLAPNAPPCAGRRPDAERETGAEHPYSSAVLGGALSMEERRAALSAFKAGRVRFLIATDVAARGIDVSGLPYVVNVTLPDPDRAEDYVHRIGRVGRAGAAGLAISLVSAVPEKVWYVTKKGYKPWALPNGIVKPADTRTTEHGGHTVWLDEGAALAAVEARLGSAVPEMGPDLSLPPDVAARAAGGAYGSDRAGAASEAAKAQAARLEALRPAVESLAALEREAQLAFFALKAGGPWGGGSGGVASK
jgi:ATP-dependent RNA helicase DDX1